MESYSSEIIARHPESEEQALYHMIRREPRQLVAGAVEEGIRDLAKPGEDLIILQA